VHRTTITARFNELDAYGHVNHAVYLTYLETARIEALAEVGIALEHLRRDGVHLVVVDLHVRYRHPARFGDVLTVDTGVTEVRAASSWWRQHIACDGRAIAAAELRGAFTDVDGRPGRVPDNVVAALHELCSGPVREGAGL
jgi:acyl-CoA thioester hydrolase